MKHTELMIRRLKEMDEDQLLELFYDLEDMSAVYRISSIAQQFIFYEGDITTIARVRKIHKMLPSITELNSMVKKELEPFCGIDQGNGDTTEYLEIDDARRGREYNLDKKRPY